MKTPVQELLDAIWDTGQIINDADYSGGTPSKKVLLRQIQHITGKALAVDRDITTSEGSFYLNQNDLDSIQDYAFNLQRRVKALEDRMTATEASRQDDAGASGDLMSEVYALAARLDKIAPKYKTVALLDDVNALLNNVDKRFAALDKRLAATESRFGAVREHVDRIAERTVTS